MELPLMHGSAEWRLQQLQLQEASLRPFLEARFIGLSDNPPAHVTSPVRPVVRGTLQRTGTSASEQGADQVTTNNNETVNQEQVKKVEVAPEGIISKEEGPDQQDEGPGLAATAGGVASKALNVAGRFALAAAVVIDSYRVGKAVYQDMRDQEALGRRTAKTTASVASGWAGGFAGAAAGNSAGAVIGGTIGAAFGGVGAIPGAAVGSLVGCLVGGVGGGVSASMAAEKFVDKISSEEVRGRVSLLSSRHVLLRPSLTPICASHQAEWLEVVAMLVWLALRRRELWLVSRQPLTHVLSLEAITGLSQLQEIEGNYCAHAEADALPEVSSCPHFLASYLLLSSQTSNLATDLVSMEEGRLEDVRGEMLCCAGGALVWLSPRQGAATAISMLRSQAPYLEVVD